MSSAPATEAGGRGAAWAPSHGATPSARGRKPLRPRPGQLAGLHTPTQLPSDTHLFQPGGVWAEWCHHLSALADPCPGHWASQQSGLSGPHAIVLWAPVHVGPSPGRSNATQLALRSQWCPTRESSVSASRSVVLHSSPRPPTADVLFINKVFHEGHAFPGLKEARERFQSCSF